MSAKSDMPLCNMNIVSIVEADMWEALWQSGRLIAGVLVLFLVFMAALYIMERGGLKKRSYKRQQRPVLHAVRTVRCEKQDKAA